MTKRLVVLTDSQIELLKYHAEDEHTYFKNTIDHDNESLKTWSDWVAINKALEVAQNG